MNIISRPIYILRGILVQISRKYFQKINFLFRNFQWGSLIPKISLQPMPLNEGGFGFSNPSHLRYKVWNLRYYKTHGKLTWVLIKYYTIFSFYLVSTYWSLDQNTSQRPRSEVVYYWTTDTKPCCIKNCVNQIPSFFSKLECSSCNLFLLLIMIIYNIIPFVLWGCLEEQNPKIEACGP